MTISSVYTQGNRTVLINDTFRCSEFILDLENRLHVKFVLLLVNGLRHGARIKAILFTAII